MTPSEELIVMTDKAAEQIKQIRDGNEEYKGKALRIFVEGGSCCGCAYGMTFDQKQEDDTALVINGIDVIVDPSSVDYIKGSKIDFGDGPMGPQFKIDNPNKAGGCSSGCGDGHGGCGDGGEGGGCGGHH